MQLIERLKEFMECERQPCAIDPQLITLEYVYGLQRLKYSGITFS